MHLSEFERRKRSLDEQLAAGLELLRAAHRAQMRALQLIWMTSPENRGALPPELFAVEAGAEAATPPPPAAPAPPARRKWKVGELHEAVSNTLDGLPATFDRADVIAALGEEPERSSLHRVLEELCREGHLEIVQRGEGRVPTRYRCTEVEGEDESAQP